MRSEYSRPFLISLCFVLSLVWCNPVYSQVNRVVAIQGDNAPDGNGLISGVDGNPVLNDLGQAAFIALMFETEDPPNDDRGIFIGDGATLSQVAREGNLVPGGNGLFSSFIRPAINDFGQTHFLASLVNTAGGSSDNVALYRGDSTSLIEVARLGQVAPDGNGTFGQFASESSIGNNGLVLFQARLDGVAGGGSEWGIFQSDGSTISQLVRSGQTSPDGNGQFNLFNKTVMNSSGQIAFTAFLNTTGTNDTRALFMTSGNSLVHVARSGQSAPDGNGVYNIINDPDINDSNTIVFRAQFTGTSGGSTDNSGVFISDGSTPVAIARKGQASPDGDGEFSFFNSDPHINSSGQVAFLSTLTGTSSGELDWM